VARGCVGELFIGGPQLALGYLNDPDQCLCRQPILSWNNHLCHWWPCSHERYRWLIDISWPSRHANQYSRPEVEVGEIEEVLKGVSMLLRSDLTFDLFDETDFAVFGLGDSAYKRFGLRKLFRRLKRLGANIRPVPLEREMTKSVFPRSSVVRPSHKTVVARIDGELVTCSPGLRFVCDVSHPSHNLSSPMTFPRCRLAFDVLLGKTSLRLRTSCYGECWIAKIHRFRRSSMASILLAAP
jgi:hypothetical protein